MQPTKANGAIEPIMTLAWTRMSRASYGVVIVGTGDQMTPVNYARYMADHIPNAQLAIIEGAGHMVAVEAPQEVADRVDTWLATL